MTGSRGLVLGVALTALVLLSGGVCAHESRPAYLLLQEIAPGEFEVLLKQPVRRSGSELGLSIRFPPSCERADARLPRIEDGVLMQRVQLRCSQPLLGRELSVTGLAAGVTDVLVNIRFFDGDTQTGLMSRSVPSFKVRAGALSRVSGYFLLGVEHLLTGADHLLFIAGLLLLVTGWLRLLSVVSAFTLAHSITLGLSALGHLVLPPAPTEAVIALTLVYLAHEILQPQRRAVANPWAIAFVFGLVHGFGFAGALADIGLPRDSAALALLLFNLGIEVGQLLVVLLLLGMAALSRVFWRALAEHLRYGMACAIGGLGVFWLLQRTLQIVT